MLGTISKILESHCGAEARSFACAIRLLDYLAFPCAHGAHRLSHPCVEAGNHLNDNLRSGRYKRVPGPGIDLFTSEGFSRVSASGYRPARALVALVAAILF